MDVTSTNPATTGTPSKSATSSNTASADTSNAKSKSSSEGTTAGALSGDFNTFLRLLTSQMQNQDPLEPTSNTEFVSQLASFSAVEQQTRTNDTLSKMFEQMTLGQGGDVGSWIGKEVLVAGGQTRYAGEPVEIGVETVEGAEKATLLVRDQNGTLVARIPASVTETSVTWDGRNQKGAELPAGLYSFQLESMSGSDTTLGTQDGTVFSKVSEVRLGEDATQLVVAGGKSVDVAAVTAIR